MVPPADRGVLPQAGAADEGRVQGVGGRGERVASTLHRGIAGARSHCRFAPPLIHLTTPYQIHEHFRYLFL